MSSGTPNQLVAYNLRRAREARGWRQAQAIQELAPHLGKRWSKSVYSGAERSMKGERVRQFSADEIVAFAKTFGVPVAWFFLPPDPESTWRPDQVAVDQGRPMSLRDILGLAISISPDLARRLSDLREIYPEAFSWSSLDVTEVEAMMTQELTGSGLTPDQLVVALETVIQILRRVSGSQEARQPDTEGQD